MITEKEFELYKKIFELENNNTGLTIGLIMVSITCLLLLAYIFITSFPKE